jgi:lambda repressor-like predicted transcriptional regulator
MNSESPRCGRFTPDAELLERIAAGESLRSLARELGISHTTLVRSLRRPDVAAALRAAELRLRAQRAREGRAEKEMRKRARQQARRDRTNHGRRGTTRRSDQALWSTDCVSRNDQLAAKTVAAGGGIQELIEATGLPTRMAVYESIDPGLGVEALANDAQRPPSGRQGAGSSRRFTPSPALIARRAAGESLRSLAVDAGVSAATLSRAFARPEVAEKVRLQQLKQREQQLVEEQRHAALIAHYTSKISDIWCPVHQRRTYVRNVESSGSETRLEIAGCCQEAIQELTRWLKIHRAVLPTGDIFTPSGHAPASATVPPA